MSDTTHYLATLPDGREFAYEFAGDRWKTGGEKAAARAVRDAGLTCRRGDDVRTVAVTVRPVTLKLGKAVHGHPTKYRVDLPLAPMTEEEFEADLAEALAALPEEFRGAVSAEAWDRGHWAGYEEVLLHARGITDWLSPAVAKYTDAVLRDHS